MSVKLTIMSYYNSSDERYAAGVEDEIKEAKTPEEAADIATQIYNAHQVYYYTNQPKEIAKNLLSMAGGSFFGKKIADIAESFGYRDLTAPLVAAGLVIGAGVALTLGKPTSTELRVINLHHQAHEKWKTLVTERKALLEEKNHAFALRPRGDSL